MKVATGLLAGLALATALAATAQVAQAAAPKVKGKYSMMQHAACSAGITTKAGIYGIDSVSGVATGFMQTGIGTLTFTGAAANSGQVAFSVITLEANPLSVNGKPSGTMKQAGDSGNGNGAYSNTATKLTLVGDTFMASYGNIVSGIAKTVNLIRVGENARCYESMTLTHE